MPKATVTTRRWGSTTLPRNSEEKQTADELKVEIRKELESYKDLLHPQIGDRDALGNQAPFSLDIVGPDYKMLQPIVDRLVAKIKNIPGLEDVEVVTDSTHPNGVFIFCKHQIPPDNKTRLDRLFHEYFPDRPMHVDDPGPLYPTETPSQSPPTSAAGARERAGRRATRARGSPRGRAQHRA